MGADPRATKEPDEPRSTTLGDLLYADEHRATPLEGEWVQLVKSIAAGDQLALHALYDRAHRPVFTLAMRITSHQQIAEEVTLDVFHAVWRQAAEYVPAAGSVLGWILNQTRWRAIDRLRFESRQKRLRPDDDGFREWTAPRDSEDAIALRERTAALREAMAVLTADERGAIESAYFSELTHCEVALQLNQPLGTIKTRIRSALAKLRAALDGSGQP